MFKSALYMLYLSRYYYYYYYYYYYHYQQNKATQHNTEDDIMLNMDRNITDCFMVMCMNCVPMYLKLEFLPDSKSSIQEIFIICS